ncbi:MAG: hypothetical protein ACYTGX_05700 [Planctomycetota bacterium]|jgi:hypothetical protein
MVDFAKSSVLENTAGPLPAGMIPEEPTTGLHTRRYPRRKARIAVLLKLTDERGAPLGVGSGVITDLTPVGAWISELRIEGGLIPIGEFRVAFRVTSGEMAGVEAVCRPVRARFGERAGMGVAFQHLRVSV